MRVPYCHLLYGNVAPIAFLKLLKTRGPLCPPAAFFSMLASGIADGDGMLVTCLSFPHNVHCVLCYKAQCQLCWVTLSSLKAETPEDCQEALDSGVQFPSTHLVEMENQLFLGLFVIERTK